MRGSWTASRAVWVAVGGAVGAAVRWAALTSVDSGGFPWPVLLFNVAGSFLLGVLLAEELPHPRRRILLHDAGAIGFCGGLTTISTFCVEVVELARGGDGTTAALYVGASVVTALAAVVAGAASLRGVRALTLPVEEEP